jgi:hypothetical protein
VSIKVPKVGEDFVELDWKAPSRDGGSKVKVYHIYQSTTPGNWQEVATVKSFDTHHSVSGLKEGVEYYFAVAAENEAGVGKRCETDKAIKPVKPKGQCILHVLHLSIRCGHFPSLIYLTYLTIYTIISLIFRKTIQARETI